MMRVTLLLVLLSGCAATAATKDDDAYEWRRANTAWQNKSMSVPPAKPAQAPPASPPGYVYVAPPPVWNIPQYVPPPPQRICQFVGNLLICN